MLEMNYSLAKKTYENCPSYHAFLLFHIINGRQREPLSAKLVEEIAKAFIYCGDYFPEDIDHFEDPILPKLMKFIHSVLERTTLSSATTVDQAIRHSCETESSIPVICPATTTITALYYLNRFKKKFGLFTQNLHVTQRLFLVAYLVAAKFIYANLKSLVNCQNIPEQQEVEDQQQADERLYIPTIQSTSFSSSPRQISMTIPSPPDTNDQQLDAKTLIIKEATHFLEQLGDPFFTGQSMNPTQLCTMEMEFLHFMDYRLELSNPLHLWDWFYTQLDEYCQLYYTTVGIGSNYVRSSNNSNIALF